MYQGINYYPETVDVSYRSTLGYHTTQSTRPLVTIVPHDTNKVQLGMPASPLLMNLDFDEITAYFGGVSPSSYNISLHIKQTSMLLEESVVEHVDVSITFIFNMVDSTTRIYNTEWKSIITGLEPASEAPGSIIAQRSMTIKSLNTDYTGGNISAAAFKFYTNNGSVGNIDINFMTDSGRLKLGYYTVSNVSNLSDESIEYLDTHTIVNSTDQIAQLTLRTIDNSTNITSLENDIDDLNDELDSLETTALSRFITR